MNSEIEALQNEIASAIHGAQPSSGWAEGRYVYEGIASISKGVCTFTLDHGEDISVAPGFAISRAFQTLRIEMAKLNDPTQAWYTAQCKVKPDGNFKFSFDYVLLPAFDIIPSAAKWLDEFSKFPRPELQAQVQDWIDGDVEAHDIVRRLARLQPGQR